MTEITYIDFEKIELRAGTVLTAERVPKKDKLLKLTVDFGEAAARLVVAGVGKTFQPEELLGGQYIFVTNLVPREVLRGLVSGAMILATGVDEEHLKLTYPQNPVPNGALFR